MIVMASIAIPEMASYDLPLPAGGPAPFPADAAGEAAHLPEEMLLRNVLWFCRLRWIVVGVLAVFGVLGQFPELLPRVGLTAHPAWPFAAAGALLLANLAFLAHARLLARASASQGATANLWAQIIVDLLVLTLVIHYFGSLETPVAFAYLFHIVLACIFFRRSWSLAVTAFAGGLYMGCVALEEAGLLAPAGIYASTALREQIDRMPGVRLLGVGWAIVAWTVVWYLASHLSALVRQRDGELAATNRRLEEAQQERTRHMLRTAHELKAPFAAVYANVQLLLKGYCGELPAEAQDVLGRIATRCRRLADEIQEMLQLANLRSRTQGPLPWVGLDLAEILRGCIAQVAPTAAARDITIEEHLQPTRTVAVEDHMKMLFANLLTNAVAYSRPGGRVRVECAASPSGPLVVIADRGIGIAVDKLPRIFDAYYRANEAVAHNRESTGLGLAIVRHVAELRGIRIRVESAPDQGTRFTLVFPPAEQSPGWNTDRKETEDGLPDGRGRRRGLRQRGSESAA